jgi:hypothetical protein
MEGPFCRAFGEVKRKKLKKAAHLFDCCENLLPTRQMEAKADTLLLQTVKLEKAIGGDHLSVCWLGNWAKHTHTLTHTKPH